MAFLLEPALLLAAVAWVKDSCARIRWPSSLNKFGLDRQPSWCRYSRGQPEDSTSRAQQFSHAHSASRVKATQCAQSPPPACARGKVSFIPASSHRRNTNAISVSAPVGNTPLFCLVAGAAATGGSAPPRPGTPSRIAL